MHTEAAVTYSSAVVEISDPSAIEAMQELGCVIFGQRDELVLVCVPDDKIDSFIALPDLGEISSSRTCTTTCNVVREFTGVSSVHDFDGGGYDGSGVVLGLSDIGFNATHAAFKGRVSRFSHFDDKAGTSFRLDSSEEILAQDTDDPAQTHATMCGNILAGAKESSPYYGMAPGSDFVAATSTLYDCGLLAGVDEVIDYAKSVGKPAVVSISIAGYTGPHDGSDLACRYLAKQADEAVIAVSAGNEGVHSLSICHDFTDENPELTAALQPKYGGTRLNGQTDIWSLDSRPFALTLEIWDNVAGKSVYSRRLSDGSGTDNSDYIILTDEDTEGIGKYFHGGGLTVSTGIQRGNGRYAAVLTYLLEVDHASGLPDYIPLLKVEGPDGVSVQMFADGVNSTFCATGVAGSTPGGASVSVNNFATTPNVLCVGSVTAQKSFALDNGYSYGVSYPYNTASSFSGYALKLADGRSLPHLVAPGVGIMTAVSSHINPSTGYSTTDADGHVSYWRADDGTSFSTPTTAGIIALWRQANPELAPAEIRDIAVRTASKDLAVPDDPRTGAGKIDALAGLNEALAARVPTGIGSGIGVNHEINILVRNGEIIAECGEEEVELEVYTPAGVPTGHKNLSPGVYICRATNASTTTTKRIIIK